MHAHIAIDNLVPTRVACKRVNDVVHDRVYVIVKVEGIPCVCEPTKVHHGFSL